MLQGFSDRLLEIFSGIKAPAGLRIAPMFDTNKLSQTDWRRVDALTDDEIDTSDIPELDASFFASAIWREPPQPPLVAIPVEPEAHQPLHPHPAAT